MQKMFKNKPVTLMRPAQEGDEGYIKTPPEQVLVRFEDGTERAATIDELTDAVEAPKPVVKVEEKKAVPKEVKKEIKKPQKSSFSKHSTDRHAHR